MRNQIEDVLDPSVPEKRIRETLASVYDEILTVNRIVNDLLSLSRAIGGTITLNKKEVEFSAFLHEFYEEASMLARSKNISVAYATGPAVTLAIDPVTIRQALFNLLDNALKHTSENGNIYLKHEVDGSTLRVEFRDSGAGIPASDLARIFDPFFQSDFREIERGVGLGLSLVQSLVKAHGGDLSVESELGKGTSFLIRLPILPLGGSFAPDQQRSSSRINRIGRE
jgi:two-component system sensor histidine kinase ResE